MQTQQNPPWPAAHQRGAADVTLNSADLLPPEQAAPLLGLSPKTLATWRSTGRHSLPYVKVGSRIRYRRADLDAWLESRLQTHTAATSKGAAA